MKISITNGDGVVTFQENLSSTKKATSSSSTSFDSVLKGTRVADKLSSVTTYKAMFKEASEKYGVDYNLLTAMAQQESGFDPNATSHSGAMGIMQLMPSTAAELGVSNPYDPYESIMGGAKYISEKLKEFNGNINLALAAYNAGSGAVNKYHGIPPFEETKNYVKNIRAIMTRGADVPEKNYISKSASKEDLTRDLEKLLSEFNRHESYDDFIGQLSTLVSEDTIETNDAQAAYENMLSQAQLVIKNILSEN